MSYTLDINTDNHYVHLAYSGTVDIEERKQARQAAFDTANQHGYSRCLVDMSQSNIEMSQTDAINFATTFKNANLPPNYRVACITKPGDQSDSLVKIIIAQDGINIRYFINQEEAIHWLIAT